MIFFPLLMAALLIAAFALPKYVQIAKEDATDESGDNLEGDSAATVLASQIELSPLEILDEIEKEQPKNASFPASENSTMGSKKVLSFFSAVQGGSFDQAEKILSELKGEIDEETMETLSGNLVSAREKEGAIEALKVENEKIQQTMSAQLSAEASALRQELAAIKESVPAIAASVSASPAAVVQKVTQDGVPENLSVAFGFDSSFLSEASKTALAPAVEAMKASGQITAQLRGFADARGSSEYNAIVAMARCESVKDFFTESGIDGGRLSVMSFGETQAGDTVDKPKRRVDIRFK